jgi:hypothetical protein
LKTVAPEKRQKLPFPADEKWYHVEFCLRRKARLLRDHADNETRKLTPSGSQLLDFVGFLNSMLIVLRVVENKANSSKSSKYVRHHRFTAKPA